MRFLVDSQCCSSKQKFGKRNPSRHACNPGGKDRSGCVKDRVTSALLVINNRDQTRN